MKPFHILVTDTNHHVRTLLKRELQQEGNIIYTASNKKQAHNYIYGPNHLDIIILDPELPDFFGRSLLKQILDRVPPVHIIIHTFKEFFNELPLDENIHLVEKSAVSIAPLKQMIASFIRK
ncbi:MAG: response regulator [Desulfobacterium sp.]|nr:response regulator [Desulfobacterium sp.]